MGHLEEIFGLAAGFPAQFHVGILSRELIGRLVGEAFLIGRCENLANHFCCGVHNQVHHFFFHFGDHAGLIEFNRFAGFDEDVFCVADGLLDMFLRLGIAGEAAFFDDALGISIGFAKDLLAADFRFGELLFDFLSVGLGLSNRFLSLFKNGDNRTESEFFRTM